MKKLTNQLNFPPTSHALFPSKQPNQQKILPVKCRNTNQTHPQEKMLTKFLTVLLWPFAMLCQVMHCVTMTTINQKILRKHWSITISWTHNANKLCPSQTPIKCQNFSPSRHLFDAHQKCLCLASTASQLAWTGKSFNSTLQSFNFSVTWTKFRSSLEMSFVTFVSYSLLQIH